MGRLLVVVRPSLVPGFHLAGVDAFPAEDAPAAQRLIGEWLAQGETGLLAIDDGLLAGFEPAFTRRLDAALGLPHLAIPGGDPLAPGASRRGLMAELIRRAIGFHVTLGAAAEREEG